MIEENPDKDEETGANTKSIGVAMVDYHIYSIFMFKIEKTKLLLY